MRIPKVLYRAVARARPLLPPAALPLVHTIRSLAGPGPLVGMPTMRRLAVVAPHPDDESTASGGLIALASTAGVHVTVIFAARGDGTIGSALHPEIVAARRRAEAEAACAMLGVSRTVFLDFPDRSLTGRIDELTEQLGDALADAAPDVVAVPWFLDGHEDHQAAAAAVARCGLAGDVEVWGSETWTPLPANRLVDITDVFDLKAAALALHRTAHEAFDVGATLALNRYRSVHGLAGSGYAEAYLAVPAATWRTLAADAV